MFLVSSSLVDNVNYTDFIFEWELNSSNFISQDDLESTRTQSRVQSDSQQSEVHHSKLKSKTPSRPTTSMGVVQRKNIIF